MTKVCTRSPKVHFEEDKETALALDRRCENAFGTAQP